MAKQTAANSASVATAAAVKLLLLSVTAAVLALPAACAKSPTYPYTEVWEYDDTACKGNIIIKTYIPDANNADVNNLCNPKIPVPAGATGICQKGANGRGSAYCMRKSPQTVKASEDWEKLKGQFVCRTNILTYGYDDNGLTQTGVSKATCFTLKFLGKCVPANGGYGPKVGFQVSKVPNEDIKDQLYLNLDCQNDPKDIQVLRNRVYLEDDTIFEW